MIISGCKYYQKKDDEYFENNKKVGKAIIYNYAIEDDSKEMYVQIVGDQSSKIYNCDNRLDPETHPIGSEIGVYYVFKDTFVGKMPRIKVIGYEDKYQKYVIPVFTAIQIISVGFILYFVYKMIFA